MNNAYVDHKDPFRDIDGDHLPQGQMLSGGLITPRPDVIWGSDHTLLIPIIFGEKVPRFGCHTVDSHTVYLKILKYVIHQFFTISPSS